MVKDFVYAMRANIHSAPTTCTPMINMACLENHTMKQTTTEHSTNKVTYYYGVYTCMMFDTHVSVCHQMHQIL